MSRVILPQTVFVANAAVLSSVPKTLGRFTQIVVGAAVYSKLLHRLTSTWQSTGTLYARVKVVVLLCLQRPPTPAASGFHNCHLDICKSKFFRAIVLTDRPDGFVK